MLSNGRLLLEADELLLLLDDDDIFTARWEETNFATPEAKASKVERISNR
jgi:hypothetical protein